MRRILVAVASLVFARCVSGAACGPDCSVRNGEIVSVDILVVYERGAKSWLDGKGLDVETFALSAVARMNAALSNTGLDALFRFSLVGTLVVNARSANISAVLDSVTDGVGAWGEVSQYRDQVGADIVTTLIDTGSESGTTGLGWTLTDDGPVAGDYSWFADFAYNVCSIRAVEIGHTMTHEVGHNMGAGHSDMQSVQPGPQLFDYSSGCYFFVDGKPYRTIMGYYTDGVSNLYYEEAPFFSSPLYTYKGVAVGDALHDNTLTLMKTYEQVAAFRATMVEPIVEPDPPVEPEPPEEPVEPPEEPVEPLVEPVEPPVVDPDPPVVRPVIVDEAKPRIDVAAGEDAPYEKAAAVYDGYVVQDGVVKGTVQVKVAKAKVKKAKKSKVEGEDDGISAKVTATVQLVGEKKKLSFKGGVADETGVVSVMSAGGHELSISLGVNGLGGELRRSGGSAPYRIDGARNVFSAKDAVSKALAKEIESMWVGAINVVGDDVVLAVSIAKKGKVKVSGTVNGVKVTATSQLLVGETACCVPVVITRKANLAFNLWLMDDGTVEVVVGGSWFADRGSWFAAAAGTLKTGAKFAFGEAAAKGLAALPGVLEEYLPTNLVVAVSGKKWVVAPNENGKAAKAGKVVFVRGTTEVNADKAGENPSGLKLTYTSKTGSFKGSFKVYTRVNDKIKSYAFNVTGVMLGDKGYGTTTLKKPAVNIPIILE